MKERWQPLLKTDGDIYQKGNKTLIVSEKEFTLQTPTEIFKRKRPMEREPRIENKLSRCANPDCKIKTIDINNPNVGYLRFKGELFHTNCLKIKDKSIYEAQKWCYESKKREMKIKKIESPTNPLTK